MNIPFLLTKIHKIEETKEERPNGVKSNRRGEEDERGRNMEEIIKNIDNQIEQKKQILFSKRQFLVQTVKENEYLKMVRTDYQKYHTAMLKSKQMQIDSMNMIKKHLDALIVEGGLTDEDMIKARDDQTNILSELEKIRGELNGLIEEE
jgi:hypothetical protein